MSDKTVGEGHRRAAVQDDSFSDAYMLKVLSRKNADISTIQKKTEGGFI